MSKASALFFPGRHARLVVVGTIAALLAVISLAAWLLLGKLAWAQETLESIEPRYARLAGLREAGEPLGAALAELETALARFAHPSDADLDRIGADTQERIRRHVAAAGLNVTGSQILPPRTHAAFTQVPLKFTVNGNLEALRELLASLDREQPIVFVDQIGINQAVRRSARRGAAAVPQEQQLVAQLNLSVLRLQP